MILYKSEIFLVSMSSRLSNLLSRSSAFTISSGQATKFIRSILKRNFGSKPCIPYSPGILCLELFGYYKHQSFCFCGYFPIKRFQLIIYKVVSGNCRNKRYVLFPIIFIDSITNIRYHHLSLLFG